MVNCGMVKVPSAAGSELVLAVGLIQMLPVQPEAVALPADRIAFAPLGDLSAAPLVIAPAAAIPITLLLSSMLTHCLGGTS